MRDGVSGQMVQHAIAQRQQHSQVQAQAQLQALQAAQAAYGYPQQQQGYQEGRSQLISATTWNPQQQPRQYSQWGGYQAQGSNGISAPPQIPPQQYNPSYMGYYGQQNGYQG